ncbi:MAG: response regulator [Planctomycetales bacterium]|nr:response regulator [Planctomycetales bacterium]
MSPKPKILCVGKVDQLGDPLAVWLQEHCEVISTQDLSTADDETICHQLDGIFILPSGALSAGRVRRLLRSDIILEGMPDGIVLLDQQNKIVWANDYAIRWIGAEQAIGLPFLDAVECKQDEPEFGPLSAAWNSSESRSFTMECKGNRFLRIHCIAIRSQDDLPPRLVVTMRDVTKEVEHQQKIAAIHDAGTALADLTADEVFQMQIEDRIELLKSNILHYTKELLNFDVVEIRLLTSDTKELVPLLSEGIEDEAAQRPLHAATEGQGVTGFVAATGKSYLCEDTTKDRLYLEGCKGAKTSLTVPLIQHDRVIGTFNVESPKPHAFTESDMQFLEIFSRDIGNSLNTLQLLEAQQANTAQASAEAIHREVALPVDEILNDAVNVMETYIGHDSSVVDRLQRILRNARDIKQLIHKVGQEMAPAEAVPVSMQISYRPQLRSRRILVVDADEAVRSAAHNLLERYGCVVETAHDGGEATKMIRCLESDNLYDVVISDIRLPDMSGYELLLKLKDLMDPVPLVLMTGFGYDPGHTIVKARQAGLPQNAVLYKPFRLDQLLSVVEGVIESLGKVTSV